MDYSKKSKEIFDDAAAKKQLEKAFSPTSDVAPKSSKVSELEFSVPAKSPYEKKVNVNYTLRPSIKNGIDELAHQQGFRSASAFVDQLLESVLQQNTKR